jgi:hypothetical protein
MKTSTANRILRTHVGSIPRPERIRALMRPRSPVLLTFSPRAG